MALLPWRFVGSSRSIGFIGYADDGTELRGKYGLERYYDDVFVSEATGNVGQFFAELFSNLGDSL